MLPQLREEIDLHEGPRLRDGQPTWTLHDPARNQFYRIDWQTFCILRHWSLDDPERICAAVAAETTLHPDASDIEHVAEFLAANQLLAPRHPDSAKLLTDRYRRQQGAWWQRLLHNYLFFRVPLVDPDGWLQRWSGRVALFYSRAFLQLTLVALVAGLLLVYRQWNQFSATLIDTLSWQGLAAYGVALAAVKLLHELGHAFTAKRHGCRVPAMGVAFMVLWPMAYTDTNEVWKLSNARQRLAVASAGVATETLIAIWATLAWALLPDGVPRSMAFFLATLSWFTTLAINASPFMRFDGYFVLSDWLDLPNLHARAFALARWDLRERLFGLDAPPPEYFPRRKQAALIAFAWGTWIYRLVVFVGIAVLVYHFFIKLAGILLFALEVVWFIARPVLNELRVWREIWPVVRHRSRARRSLWIAALMAGLVFLPWPARLTASGHLKPQESLTVYAPAGAQVVELPWKEGADVPQGAALVKLASADLTLRWQRAESRLAQLREQAAAATVGDTTLQHNVQVLQQELAAAEAERASVQAEAVRYAPVAPFAGKLHAIDPELRPGDWVRRQEPLLTLVKPGAWIVEAYLDEDEVRRVQAGDGASFHPKGFAGAALPLRVSAVDKDATRVLPQGMLAVKHGGSVLTRDKDGTLVPERSVYRVTLAAQGDPGALAGHAWRGTVVIRGSWEAPALRYLRSALALIWREAGF
ncbi:MAG TPA: HlyD family efflux transporter periplasmic adaptor subunit [Ramlibacter sp.]|uniref:HlyD family efflux transporter periplasmic adaptor subunit n=1 Tax=Ramlibacter sp. TaxID=1917967 RepID=UPI002ED246F3